MSRAKRRSGAMAISVAAHLALVAAMLSVEGKAPAVAVPEAISVTLVQPPALRPLDTLPDPVPDPVPDDPGATEPSAVEATAPVVVPKPEPARPQPRPVRTPRPVPPQVETVVARAVATVAPAATATVSDAQLAGATRAGSGSGGNGLGGTGSGTGTASGSGANGGRCDMVERLQAALREDPEVRQAVGAAHRAPGVSGRALLVWDGDWVLTPGQSGKGLAGVRQAIALEVAFAPAACRAEAMRGLVVVSFNDGPGAPRLAFGRDQWRWSDMLK